MIPEHADWATYFREYRLGQNVKDDADDEEKEPAFTVTASTTDVDPAKLRKSPKGVYAAVAGMGWKVLLGQATALHAAAYMAADGKPRKDGTQALKGELKKPAHEKTVVHMGAAHSSGKIGFTAYWVDGAFASAIVRDPVGIPVELYFDYTPSKERQETLGEVEAFARADAASGEYNDGKSYLAHKRVISAMTEFTTWLEDWQTMLAPADTKEEAA